eukprot:SAG31_NODE_39077_length_291_cov_0.796875_1_plen_23_part_01
MQQQGPLAMLNLVACGSDLLMSR